MKCPLCQAVNIDGSDLCESCGCDLVETEDATGSSPSLAQILRAPLAEAGLRDPITLRPDDSVATAVARMSAQSWGSVLVLEGERVVGVFTEQDLLRRMGPEDDLSNRRLLEVMTPDPDIYPSDLSVGAGVNAMAERGVRHLPVVDEEGRLRGNLGVRMVLAHLRRSAGL
jgi:CBS domain-containing protein